MRGSCQGSCGAAAGRLQGRCREAVRQLPGACKEAVRKLQAPAGKLWGSCREAADGGGGGAGAGGGCHSGAGERGVGNSSARVGWWMSGVESRHLEHPYLQQNKACIAKP